MLLYSSKDIVYLSTLRPAETPFREECFSAEPVTGEGAIGQGQPLEEHRGELAPARPKVSMTGV
jgi:hypothetical protein